MDLLAGPGQTVRLGAQRSRVPLPMPLGRSAATQFSLQGAPLPIADVPPAGSPGLPPPIGELPPSLMGHTDGASKVKLATVLDQSCDAEVKILGTEELRAMLTAWKKQHNDNEEPTEEEEASGEQLTALAHRLRQGTTPYVDFGVWRPHGQDLGRACKFAAHFQTAPGVFTMKEISGPACYADWERSWRVFKFAMEMLGAASRTRLDKYKAQIENLNRDYPTMWWLVAVADIKMRKVHLERIRRRLIDEHLELTGAGLRSDFDPLCPWDQCFREAARDRDFWAQEVERKVVQVTTHQRSKAEVIDPGFGSLQFAAPAGQGATAAHAEGPPRKAPRPSKAERRAAALAGKAKAPAPAGGGHPAPAKGGKDKGKGKTRDLDRRTPAGNYFYDKAGKQLCWTWNATKNGCTEPCPNGRAHVCEVCRGEKGPAGHRTCEHV